MAGPVVVVPAGLLDRGNTPQGNTTFADSATKTFGWKSSLLKTLIAEITTYQNNPSDGQLRKVHHSLFAWMADNPKEALSNKRGSNAATLAQEILDIAAQRRWRVWAPPKDLIAVATPNLDRCKIFACTDVGTFRDDINDALPDDRQQHIYALGTQHGRSTGRPIIPNGGRWDPDGLRAAYDQVFGAAAGECTSFAYAAAHILTTGVSGGFVPPRIEVVTFRHHRQALRFNRDGTPMYKKDASGNFTNQQAREFQYVTHVFCVAGRIGQNVAYGQRMPAAGTWGASCRIVDCWLGALGYECSFKVPEYPKPGYLTTGFIFKEMDSYLGPQAVKWLK